MVARNSSAGARTLGIGAGIPRRREARAMHHKCSPSHYGIMMAHVQGQRVALRDSQFTELLP